MNARGIAAGLLLFGACDVPPPAPPPGAGRVQAVVAKAPTADALAGFCDVRSAQGVARPLRLPMLSVGRETAGLAGVRWVNLWATWCKPCVEELPMIEEWRAGWKKQGRDVEVAFVSVDGSADDIAKFRTEHPGVPIGHRLADPSELTPWMEGIGLDPGAGLPLHVFTDVSGAVRCVRAGAVTEDHRSLVESLVL